MLIRQRALVLSFTILSFLWGDPFYVRTEGEGGQAEVYVCVREERVKQKRTFAKRKIMKLTFTLIFNFLYRKVLF